MSFLIYLDQNTLSNLRQRKIDEMKVDEYIKLKLVLKLDDVIPIYSFVTLQEISQIKSEDYKKEHINLLSEINAAYIEPNTHKLANIHPEVIWESFLKIQKENLELGIDSVLSSTELFSRKISGIQVGESFEDINNGLNDSLNNMLELAFTQLASVDLSSLPEEARKALIDFQLSFNALHINPLQVQSPKIEDNEQLGPQPFRNMNEIKALDILNADVNEVVKKIETVFQNKNSTFNLNDFFDKTPESDVARAYCLMNWAGYYPDDFTKITRGKDRFKSSQNDMLHVIAALGADFLISDDTRFCKKARACFAYSGFNTITCSTKDFIETYCKFE